MFNYVLLRLVQASERVRSEGLAQVAHDLVHFERQAVPVEKDLRGMEAEPRPAWTEDGTFAEVTEELLDNAEVVYPFQNRRRKARYYLGKGWGGYALLKGRTVLGDIWYAPVPQDTSSPCHPDVSWLGIRPEGKSVYTFDMFIDPEERGNNTAFGLQRATLQDLRTKGFEKAYGFYWADNIPALWMHRSLRWKPLARRRSDRFFFYRRSRPAADRPARSTSRTS
ncbi:MAG: GNAT family N-acetyltransferase [bacterium]